VIDRKRSENVDRSASDIVEEIDAEDADDAVDKEKSDQQKKVSETEKQNKRMTPRLRRSVAGQCVGYIAYKLLILNTIHLKLPIY